jgi:uncharacterized NAD(P)/FAD-binding protein YdhS
MALTNITIIGGGACGISAFIELFLELRIANRHQQVSITIIEENPEIGKGLAFGTKEPGHILNTQADLMGIHFSEPAHFSQWLITHEQRVEEEVVDNQGKNEAFTTRRLYGTYLKEQFERYFDLAKKEKMQVNVVHTTALNVTPLNEKFEIQLADGESLQSDFVILAPGTPVANNYPELEDKPNYFSSPWPSEPILEKIPRDVDVAILGSSLSAIDALMTLVDNGYTGKIRCYALDGLMPRVQPEKPTMINRKHLTIANLHEIQRTKLRNPTVKEMFRLFIKEFQEKEGKTINWNVAAREDKSAQELLNEDIMIAKNGGDALINIPYSLRYDSSEMWKWLAADEKLKFKKWLGRYWAINRHCMPLYNAERIAELFHNDKLEIIKDLEEVTYDESQGAFIMQFQKGMQSAEKYLINATGPAAQVKAMKSELMQNLSQSGVIEADPVGGIKVFTETMQVVSGETVNPHLYAVGHITNGVLLDVNAVWFNVKMIGKLCRHVTAQIIGQAS